MNDATGLVCAYQLDGKGGGKQLSWSELGGNAQDGRSLWIHLDYEVEDARTWLLTASGISPLICEALLARDPRPRAAAFEDDSLLFIIRGVNLNEGAAPQDMVSVRCYVTATRIVTLRHRQVVAIKELAEEVARGVGPKSAPDLLITMADRLVARIAAVTDTLDDEVAALEDRVIDETGPHLRAKLADLRRQAISLRRYLAPERDVLSRLRNEPLTWITPSLRDRLRESDDRLTRILEELDAARERAAVTHEELSSRLSEMTNQRLYVLSIVAAVFLPLGLITGIFGVNLGGIPGIDWGHGFAALCAAMTILLGFQLWLFRRLGWL